MKLPPQDWTLSAGGQALMAALDTESGATRLVGGAVRDALLGLPVSDVDLATKFSPQEVIERLEAAGLKAVPTGLKHGTVTAVSHGLVAEVTTLRRDVATDGRHADVAFTDDWREDAARRDFTINALNAILPDGDMTDFFGGLDDLDARRVRFIGDPLTRIAEDHLRILRFFRFHARFAEGAPDADGLAACIARARDMMALSRERIAGELLKMLALPDPVSTLRIMVENGIWTPILPEIDDGSVDRLAVLIERERSVDAPPDGMRRLAALLPADAQTALRIARQLRLSKRQAAHLSAAAVPLTEMPGDVRSLAYYEGRDVARDRLFLSDSSDLKAALAPLDHWQKPQLPISGKHLIDRGLKPGPGVSAALQRFETSWVAAGFPRDRAAVDDLITSALAG
ncbi:MAG: CCA tRNA nucleotidyltransferase [Pacificimonas sp.]